MQKQVIPLNFETYLSVVKGNVGSSAYSHLWARIGGKKKDIVDGGRLSCAFFVSFVLRAYGFTNSLRASVPGMVKELEASGWQKTKKFLPGSVLVWEDKLDKRSGERHSHVGFYIGKNRAISNDGDKGVIKEHHFTYGKRKGLPIRKVVAIYWKPEIAK